MSEENQYIQQRREKMAQYRAQGANPFPNGMAPSITAVRIQTQFADDDTVALEAKQFRCSVAGRLMAVRSFGKAAFLKLRDRSGQAQVFIQQASLSPEQFELYKNLDVGDHVWCEGILFRTKTNELSVKADQLKLVTKSLQPLPEKWHGLTDVEIRYRQRYVDLIANEHVKQTFVTRSKVVQAIRDFLVQREFLEVETPMMHPIPGGAAAKPFVTHHNKLHMDLYLRIAPELYLKRLVVGGFERVFEINRNFRNEGISIQHNPEFTMLEFYQSYATYEDLMKLTEEMLGEVAMKVHGSHQVQYQGTELNFAPPYQRLSMKQAVVEVGGVSKDDLKDRASALACLKRLGGKPKADHEGFGALLTEIFELTTEGKLIQPTFITEYPTEVSPLARRSDANPEVTDRFEFFVFGREIANGFSELNDPDDQAERFKAQVQALEGGNDEAMHFDADYINALEYGMPPTAGEGIGIDRLVMLMTDSASIRDVILFPQLKRHAEV